MYNYPIDARSMDQIYSKCFQGLGFINCKPVNADDNTIRANALPYYLDMVTAIDAYYCAQCCFQNQEVDIWDLSCPMTVSSAAQSNVYGYVLYMAVKSSKTDTSIISCPLKRSGCTYDDSGKTIGCNRFDDTKYLVGYTLTGIYPRLSSSYFTSYLAFFCAHSFFSRFVFNSECTSIL
jgi:hypothetical protein